MLNSLISELFELNTLIALSKSFNFNVQINGLRHPRTETLNGRYMRSGEDFNASFVIPYLEFPTGNHFLIDNKGYGIWPDEN